MTPILDTMLNPWGWPKNSPILFMTHAWCQNTPEFPTFFATHPSPTIPTISHASTPSHPPSHPTYSTLALCTPPHAHFVLMRCTPPHAHFVLMRCNPPHYTRASHSPILTPAPCLAWNFSNSCWVRRTETVLPSVEEEYLTPSKAPIPFSASKEAVSMFNTTSDASDASGAADAAEFLCKMCLLCYSYMFF